jgi:hypothetical protein
MDTKWFFVAIVALAAASVFMAIGCAAVAGNRGRDRLGWFFLGLLFNVFALMVLRSLDRVAAPLPIPVALPLRSRRADMRECPKCGGETPVSMKCLHCGAEPA